MRIKPWLFIITTGLASVACSTSSDPDTEETESAMTGTLSGGFVVDEDEIPFDFQLEYDLAKKKAVWSATLKDPELSSRAENDVDVPGDISNLAECNCSFTATVPGKSGQLAVLKVRNLEVISIVYEGKATHLTKP